ncbi:cellulose-binding family II [Plectosphaerella plurivora]|uniref:Cellulose-binding family II n=1 Tax=Plectosphaerella plurivora TaxID=936078 RepID=A0A9P9A9T8_9PEZI|nr:cellulose-binding family II [Plectosphaerella plurivora]
MRTTLLPTVALALASLAQGLDLSNPSDSDSSVWESITARDEGASDPASNRPAKRQSGWNPPSSLVSPLKQVWDHCLATYSGGLFGFRNYGWDQLMASSSGGSVNLCVRWESNTPVTEAQRAQIATQANKQYQKWFSWLYGYDGFPYSNIPVRVVGWAVRDRNLLQGSTSGLDIYTDVDGEGIPQCATACGRFFNQNGDYSRCPGGASRRYDQSLWLTDGFGGGAGGDWGQRMGREYFMGAINSENIHIFLHEIGHTWGLDDFYDWSPSGVAGFIMKAGSATSITDFDGWMLRNWWYELSRNRGWRSGTAPPTTPPPTTPPPTTPPPTTPPPTSGGGTVPKWGQCGGQGWTGGTVCVAGSTCTPSNQWYSQCL